MNGILIGALMAMSMAQQTDTTFAVGNADALHVETMGGSITIEVWDRDEVRIRGEHSSRTYIDIDRNSGHIDVEPEARRGPANLVDFTITVPRRLALELEANYGDIIVDGADGEVDIETVQGDIYIRGGRGSIKLSNTTGAIVVEGAQGQIEIESSAADVRITDSGGEIFAETAGGSVVMENITATAVDVGSTGGRVHFDGDLDPRGTYFFGSHGGSVTIVVREGARASFNLATVHGSITSNLEGQARSFEKGKRHSFEIGGGGALVEAETYGGRVRLVRAGSDGARAPQIPRRDGDGIDVADLMEGSHRLGWDFEHDVDGWADEWAEECDCGWEGDGEWAEDLAHELSDAWAPRVSARVNAHVSAVVAPRVSALVSPRVDAAVAPAVAAALGVAGIAPRADVPSRRPIRR